MMRSYETSTGLLELDTEEPLTKIEAEKIAKNMMASIEETSAEAVQAADHDKGGDKED